MQVCFLLFIMKKNSSYIFSHLLWLLANLITDNSGIRTPTYKNYLILKTENSVIMHPLGVFFITEHIMHLQESNQGF